MPSKIQMSELKNLVSSELKNKGLESYLGKDTVDRIANSVKERVNLEYSKNTLPETISEDTNPDIVAGIQVFPKPADNFYLSGDTKVDKIEPQSIDIDQGTTGNVPQYQKTLPLPSFIEKIAPAQIIIFNENEVSAGGETLSGKKFRTLENPDMKKSMIDLWINEAKKKADVYLAKFEKIGQIDYNYTNGTSQFIQNSSPKEEAGKIENPKSPLQNEPSPEIIKPEENKALETYIKNSINLEKVVADVVRDILKKELGGGQNHESLRPVKETSPDQPFGYDVSQSVKPMEESFEIKIYNIIEDENFIKIETPSILKESIQKNSTEFLSKQNEEINEWIFENKKFYTMKNPISINTCYILKEGETCILKKKKSFIL